MNIFKTGPDVERMLQGCEISITMDGVAACLLVVRLQCEHGEYLHLHVPYIDSFNFIEFVHVIRNNQNAQTFGGAGG